MIRIDHYEEGASAGIIKTDAPFSLEEVYESESN